MVQELGSSLAGKWCYLGLQSSEGLQKAERSVTKMVHSHGCQQGSSGPCWLFQRGLTRPPGSFHRATGVSGSPRVSGPRESKEETAMPSMTYSQKSQSTISTTFYPLETSRAHAQRRGMKPLLIGRIISECVDTFLNHHKGSFLLSFGASDLQVRNLWDLSFILSKY